MNFLYVSKPFSGKNSLHKCFWIIVSTSQIKLVNALTYYYTPIYHEVLMNQDQKENVCFYHTTKRNWIYTYYSCKKLKDEQLFEHENEYSENVFYHKKLKDGCLKIYLYFMPKSYSKLSKNIDIIINKNQISNSFSISYQNHVRSFPYSLKRNTSLFNLQL